MMIPAYNKMRYAAFLSRRESITGEKPTSFPKKIHFQWIPSHVNIAGNEIADSLTRAGTSAGETTMPAALLTYLELFSKHKPKNKAIWMIPLVHP
ncbi:hypothetical protein TNCV_2541591 [Trichonephila clavipes]|nr:hypothetical protein TNCV_2541591 [Trichonephila clavipes]